MALTDEEIDRIYMTWWNDVGHKWVGVTVEDMRSLRDQACQANRLKAALAEALDRWAGAVHVCDDPNLDQQASFDRIAELRRLLP